MLVIKRIVFWLLLSTPVCGVSFLSALQEKRNEIKEVIGEKKLMRIEREFSDKELYRITQLLALKGIGEKAIIRLEKIIGTRFSSNLSSPYGRYNKSGNICRI